MITISQAAQRAGLSTKAVRYYADIGLLPEAGRSDKGYRLYDEATVATLTFLRRARDFGFSIPACKELLGLFGDQDRQSAEVKSIASQHLERLEAQRAELDQLCHSLTTLIDRCPGDGSPDCPILEELA